MFDWGYGVASAIGDGLQHGVGGTRLSKGRHVQNVFLWVHINTWITCFLSFDSLIPCGCWTTSNSAISIQIAYAYFVLGLCGYGLCVFAELHHVLTNISPWLHVYNAWASLFGTMFPSLICTLCWILTPPPSFSDFCHDSCYIYTIFSHLFFYHILTFFTIKFFLIWHCLYYFPL